jgi:hypothetical protein
MDITEEDLDDLREAMDPSGTCLVCLSPCKAWSNDLFLYTCHCVYRIHPECFKMWRSRTGTDRVCLICREEFDTFVAAESESEAEAEPQERQERHPLVIFRPYEGPQETCGTYLTKIWIMCMILIIIGYIIAMSKHVLR